MEIEKLTQYFYISFYYDCERIKENEQILEVVLESFSVLISCLDVSTLI